MYMLWTAENLKLECQLKQSIIGNKMREIKQQEIELLNTFASIHLGSIETLDTPNEKTSRYLLEKLGYMDKARERWGGKYLNNKPSPSEMLYLHDYYNKNIL